MDSQLSRLESLLGKIEMQAAPSRTYEERLNEAVARAEKLFALGYHVGGVQSATSAAGRVKGQPKLELQARGTGKNRKWVVEYQVGRRDLVMRSESPKQTVYILGCVDCAITIEGKFSSVILDQCCRTDLTVKEDVHTCEVLGCNDVKVQMEGAVSSVVIDNTMDCGVYLSDSARDAVSIDTSRSWAVHVKAMGLDTGVETKEGEEGDSTEATPVEHAIPEHFVTKFNRESGVFESQVVTA